MNTILAFILGNIAKLTTHMLFPHEGYAIITDIFFCALIYLTAQNKIGPYIVGIIGFATHELWFTDFGIKLGMMYMQYDLTSLYYSIAVFAILQIFTITMIKWITSLKQKQNQQPWFK